MVHSIVWGLVIIAVGLWIWLANLGLVTGIVFSRDWPVIVIVVGVMTVAGGIARRFRRRG